MYKAMFMFLDTLHPNLFRYRTKFGIIPRYSKGGSYTISGVKDKDVRKLCNTFNLSWDDGMDVYTSWLGSKPIATRIKNSTNEDVFVFENPTIY